MPPTKSLCYPLQGKEVEAVKPVPHVGTSWGGWSQWRNRLPHQYTKEVACCEACLCDPSGVVGTPTTMAWVLC